MANNNIINWDDDNKFEDYNKYDLQPYVSDDDYDTDDDEPDADDKPEPGLYQISYIDPGDDEYPNWSIVGSVYDRNGDKIKVHGVSYRNGIEYNNRSDFFRYG